jgi:hypothetical protein
LPKDQEDNKIGSICVVKKSFTYNENNMKKRKSDKRVDQSEKENTRSTSLI